MQPARIGAERVGAGVADGHPPVEVAVVGKQDPVVDRGEDLGEADAPQPGAGHHVSVPSCTRVTAVAVGHLAGSGLLVRLGGDCEFADVHPDQVAAVLPWATVWT